MIDELERERATGALVAVYGRGHEHEVRSEEILDQGQGNGGRLVDHHQLGLAELERVRRMNVLNGLAMVAEDVDANDGLVELGIGRLHQLVVDVLLVLQGVEALEHELEQGLQVLGCRRGHKYVRVTLMKNKIVFIILNEVLSELNVEFDPFFGI